MKFSVNHWVLFVLVGVIIAAVLAQSTYFLVKAMRRAKELGIGSKTVKKTITSSAIFTIAPAIAVLVGVVALAKSLGVAIPWLRLSVIGSLTYETVAAGNALNAAGMSAGTTVNDPSIFVTILWVMTIGIAAGIILVPFVTRKIQKGVNKIGMKDKKWGEIFNNAMFLGMISAFLGYVFCDVGRLFMSEADRTVKGVVYSTTSGLIPVCVMGVSALLMAILGLLSMKTKAKWLTDYALPVSLVAGMASAIPFTAWLG